MKEKNHVLHKLLRYGLPVLFLSAVWPSAMSQQTERYTLWLDGLGTTSKGWGNAPQVMKALGYDLVDIIGDELPYTIYKPELGVEAAAQELAAQLQPFDDILVLAHDYGGLVARQLANISSNNIGALVLLGVPNYGSGALEWAVKPINETDEMSQAQFLIQQLKMMKAQQGCEGDCNLLESFEQWIELLRNSPQLYEPMFPESPELVQLNEHLPQIPYVVIYGTIEDYSLAKFLSTLYFDFASIFEDPVGACEEFLATVKLLARKRALIKETIANLNGFLNTVKNLIATTVDPTKSGLATAVASIVQNYFQSLMDQIDMIAKHNEAMAREMRCFLINKYLEVEWLASISTKNGVNVKEEEIWVPSYTTCYNECTMYFPNDPYEVFYDCIPSCVQEEPVLAYSYESLHDGLLSLSEQMLEGAVKEYHLPGKYHLQQPVLTDNPLLADLLIQIFDGDAGAAFAVPK